MSKRPSARSGLMTCSNLCQRMGWLVVVVVAGLASCDRKGESENVASQEGALAIDGNSTGTNSFSPSRLNCAQYSENYSPGQTAPYTVASTTKTYVDPGRTTRGFSDSYDDDDRMSGSGGTDTVVQRDGKRTLPTTIWYPAVGTATSFPVVVYAHGIAGNRDEAAIYAPHLASWGYIVVAPRFPEFHLKERNPADWTCPNFHCNDGDGLCTAAGGTCGDGTGTCVQTLATGASDERCAPRMAANCKGLNDPHTCCASTAGTDESSDRCWKPDPATYNFSKGKTTEGRRVFLGGMHEVARDIQFVADQVIREYNDDSTDPGPLTLGSFTKVKKSSGGSGKTDVGVIGLGSMIPQFVGQHPNVKIPTSTISAASSQTVDGTVRDISVSNTNGFAPTNNGTALRPTFWAKLTTGGMTAVACIGVLSDGKTFDDCTISGSDSLPAGSPIYQSAVFTRATAVNTVIPTSPSTTTLDVTGTHGFRYVSGQYKLYVQAATGGGVRLVTCTGPSPGTPGTQFTGCSVASSSVTVPQNSSVDDASYTTLDRNVHAFNLRAVVGAGSRTFTQGAYNFQPVLDDYIPNNDVAYTWITGTSDMLMPPDYARRSFNFTKGSVNWIELSGATHFGFFGQEEPDGADTTGRGICETYMCRTPSTSAIFAPTAYTTSNPYFPSGNLYHCSGYWDQDPGGEFFTAATAAPVGTGVTTFDTRGQGPFHGGAAAPYNQGDWGYCDYRARGTGMTALNQVAYLKDMAVATFRANLWGKDNDATANSEIVKGALCRMRNVDADNINHPNFSLKQKWYRESIGYCASGQSWNGTDCVNTTGKTGPRLTPGGNWPTGATCADGSGTCQSDGTCSDGSGSCKTRDIAFDGGYVYFTGKNTSGNQSIQRVPFPGNFAVSATSIVSTGTPTRLAFNSSKLFFINATGGSPAYKVSKVNKDGSGSIEDVSGADTTARGCSKLEDLAVNETYVVVSCSGGSTPGVYSVPIAGGTIYNSSTTSTDPRMLALDATNVYWADRSGGKIFRKAIAASAAGDQIATGRINPTYVALDQAYVYFTNQAATTSYADLSKQSLQKVLKTGTGNPSLSILTPGGLARKCVSAANECGPNGNTCTNNLCTQPTTACDSDTETQSTGWAVVDSKCQVTMAAWEKTPGLLGPIAVDGSNVYFASADKLYSMSKNLDSFAYVKHNPPSSLALTGSGSTISRLSLNNSGVLFTVTGGGGNYDGANHYVETNPGAKLVGYWTMSEGSGTTTADSSGWANNGTLSSSPAPTWVDGINGKALDFGMGSNGARVTVNDSVTLDITQGVTLSAWFTVPYYTQLEHTIISKIDTDGNGTPISGYRLFTAGDPFTYWVCGYVYGVTATGGAAQRNYCTEYTPSTTFKHVAFTYSQSAGVAIYLDGVLKGSADAGLMTTISTNNEPLTVGGSDNKYSGGKVDEARVYNGVLTAAEVKRLYDSTNSGKVGEWLFNEGHGSVTEDGSVFAGNGVLLYSPTWTTSGKVGTALSFSPSGSYVEVPVASSPALNLNDKVSISTWYKGAFSWGGVFAAKSTGVGYGATAGYGLIMSGQCSPYSGCWDVLCGFVKGYTGAGACMSATGWSSTTWNHIVLTYDRTNIKLYLNGSLGVTQPYTQAVSTSTQPFQMGYQCPGTQDQTRVYNRGLSQAEVTDLYNNP